MSVIIICAIHGQGALNTSLSTEEWKALGEKEKNEFLEFAKREYVEVYAVDEFWPSKKIH